MLTAEYTIGNKPRGSEDIIYRNTAQEFATIDGLEDFLAYNRAYITKIKFHGKLDYTMEEDN
jgi:hypothetical protein